MTVFKNNTEFTSEWEDQSVQVSQGSMLDPVLFVIYINDLKSGVNSTKPISYADDTTAILQANLIIEMEVLTKLTLENFLTGLMSMGLNKTAKNSGHKVFFTV